MSSVAHPWIIKLCHKQIHNFSTLFTCKHFLKSDLIKCIRTYNYIKQKEKQKKRRKKNKKRRKKERKKEVEEEEKEEEEEEESMHKNIKQFLEELFLQ